MPVGYQSELIAHEGAEFAYVLSVRISYRVDGRDYPLARLHTFRCGQAHHLANVGDQPAEVLTAMTMGLFDDLTTR